MKLFGALYRKERFEKRDKERKRGKALIKSK
jgi:hypothetical protein